MAKTLRVHHLAKELGVLSKVIIAKCNAEGVEPALKNHMAAVSAGLAESIREWFSAGVDVTTIEVARPVDLEKVKKPRKRKAKPKKEAEVAAAEAERGVAAVAAPPAEEVAAAAAEKPPEAAPPEPMPAVAVAPPEEEALPEVAEKAAVAETVGPPEPPPEAVPEKPAPPPEPVRPAGPQIVPKPAELKGPRLVRIEAPEPARPPRVRPAALHAPESGSLVGPTVERPERGRGRNRTSVAEARAPRTRSPRRRSSTADVTERLQEWRDQDLIERRERLASATGHGVRARRSAERTRRAGSPIVQPTRRTEVEITTPIMLKEFCAAVGVPFGVVFTKLMEQTGAAHKITDSIDSETAELVALDLGITLAVKHARTALEELEEEFQLRERYNLQPRPPVVAMLGHVDHGKTSLLDHIRRTHVADSEAGGITQHIGAYRVKRGNWNVTFVDTPGHEAFTAMRARGANLTDVVVLVVAVDDGVMPQTIEAINHVKAAGVQIVVALNKIDLPGVDERKIYAQLAEQDLTPAAWGGHTDVVRTSAVTGEGIDELLSHLTTLSELMDLKADPTVPAHAAVIEAQMREGRGGVAQVLVREGTLKVGQVMVCGPGSGRVRTLLDYRGKRVKEAEPGTPVEVIGLDALPNAGDHLYVVDGLPQAKEIAEEIWARRREEALTAMRKPQTLQDLLAGQEGAEVPELNVIIKADVQGSVDVLRRSLGEFPSDNARLRILHAGVGAISEADVELARASRALVIGFQVVPEERARQLAEQCGVEIRLYRVIYDLHDDLYRALEGLLAPEQAEESRGRAEVREVFSISRVGRVAGCYVVEGMVARNQRVRLIRDGRIVAEGHVIGSLKRFKDDIREVRAGLECGIKIDGYGDIKPGDVIEAYEIVEVAQRL